MKFLSPLVALYLPGASMLQIMMIMAAAILLFKTTVNKISGVRREWMFKRRIKQMENNMWAIE